jgi:tetratricopeptide (TPR) repeat protein
MAVLAIFVVMMYQGALQNSFVAWDDMTYIVENPLITEPSMAHFWELWHTPISLNFHPLTMWSLLWNASLTGTSEARGFILTNILLHSINTVLVYRLARRLSENEWVAVATALLWGLHPMRVESVAWVSERKDVLYGLFFLAGCLSYLRFQRSQKTMWWWLTLGLFVLSCLSKAMAVVFPLVLILLDYWKNKDEVFSLKALLNKLPFFGVAALFGMIALNVQRGGNFYGYFIILEQKQAVSSAFSLSQKLQFGGYGFMQYILKFFAPVGLSPFYSYPTATDSMTPYIGGLLLMALLLVGSLAFWKKEKAVVFGVGFYFVTVALVLQIISVGIVIMADRYTYLPHIGLAFMFVYLSQKYLVEGYQLSPYIVYGVWGALGAFFMAQTKAQTAVWQNTETLWSKALTENPKAGDVYVLRGNYLGKNGKVDEAILDFEQALSLQTHNFSLFEGLGNAYGTKGKPEKAVEMFTKAIEIQPLEAGPYYNRGIANLGIAPEKSIPDFKRALELYPANAPRINAGLAYAYLQSKDYKMAVTTFDLAIQGGNLDPANYLNRSVAKFNLGDKAGAIADCKQAIALKPDFAPAQQQLKALGG